MVNFLELFGGGHGCDDRSISIFITLYLLGQSSSGPKEPMYSYAQASAFTSINKQQGSSRGGPVGGGVPTSVQPQPNKPATQVVGGRGASNRGIGKKHKRLHNFTKFLQEK